MASKKKRKPSLESAEQAPTGEPAVRRKASPAKAAPRPARKAPVVALKSAPAKAKKAAASRTTRKASTKAASAKAQSSAGKPRASKPKASAKQKPAQKARKKRAAGRSKKPAPRAEPKRSAAAPAAAKKEPKRAKTPSGSKQTAAKSKRKPKRTVKPAAPAAQPAAAEAAVKEKELAAHTPKPGGDKAAPKEKKPAGKPIAAYFRSSGIKAEAKRRDPQSGSPTRAYVSAPGSKTAPPKAGPQAAGAAKPPVSKQAGSASQRSKRPAPKPSRRRKAVPQVKTPARPKPPLSTAPSEAQPVSPGDPVLPFSGLQFIRGPEPVPHSEIDRGKAIPTSYAIDRLVAVVRDPHWIFCYWELTGDLLKRIREIRGSEFVDACAWVLRLHRYAEGMAVDVQAEPRVGNWYVYVGAPGEYQLELGLLSSEGEYLTLLASQVVVTPSDRPSDVTDEEWESAKQREEELYRRLLKELGLTADARKRGVSGFVGASGVPSSWPAASWRLPGSFLGASGGQSGAGLSGAGLGLSSAAAWSGVLGVSSALGASESGRPLPPAAWVSSFPGASGRPSSMGSGGMMEVGWILGADGRHEVVMLRPGKRGGANWHVQAYLPAQVDTAEFTVKLPRVVHDAPHPAPSWPPAVGESGGSVTSVGDVSPAIVPWAHPEPVKLTADDVEDAAASTSKRKRRNGTRRGSSTGKRRKRKR